MTQSLTSLSTWWRKRKDISPLTLFLPHSVSVTSHPSHSPPPHALIFPYLSHSPLSHSPLSHSPLPHSFSHTSLTHLFRLPHTSSLSCFSYYACRHCYTLQSDSWHHAGPNKTILCNPCRNYFLHYGVMSSVQEKREPAEFMFK